MACGLMAKTRSAAFRGLAKPSNGSFGGLQCRFRALKPLRCEMSGGKPAAGVFDVLPEFFKPEALIRRLKDIHADMAII